MAKCILSLHSPTLNKKNTKKSEIDWLKCVVCQETFRAGQDKSIPDGKSKGQSGYVQLIEALVELNEFGKLPSGVDIERMNDGSGILQTLEKNNAGFHRLCKLDMTKKLKRFKEKNPKRKSNDNSIESCSPVKTRRTLGSAPQEKGICIICEEPTVIDGKLEVNCASTKGLDRRIREMAIDLNDRKLMAKLVPGDVIAINVSYHKNCYTNLFNRWRGKQRSLKRIKNDKISIEALVLAELVAFIEEARQDGQILSFKLSELTSQYKNRIAEIKQVDTKEVQVRVTTLKDRILRQIPELEEHKGKDNHIFLMFPEHVGPTIQHAFDNSDDNVAVKLVRAVQVIRNDFFEENFEFSGSFEENCEQNSIPNSLLTIIQMMLEGSSFDKAQSNPSKARERASLSIAQLLYFNSVKRSRSSSYIRHNKSREVPLPIYISMLIHAKTRSKSLIDKLYDLGLCVSYDRLMDISTDLANEVCAQYEEDQVVCPLNLLDGVFTCGAVDNIDHNPSARTAKDSFHGTAISLMQFPTTEVPGVKRIKVQRDGKRKSRISPLPLSYSLVPSTTATFDPVVPTRLVPLSADEDIIKSNRVKETDWLSNLSKKINSTEDDIGNLSWAAHHASGQPTQSFIPSKIALLPLFRESAHSTCMMSHAMQMVTKAIHHLNPTQIPVVVVDQPLYAICKQIQWTWPESHGEDKIVVMMGGLHIEMNLLKLLGDWLSGSGWIASIVQAGITTSGRADAMLKGSHVTGTRYAHQVSVGGLQICAENAYQQYKDNAPANDILTFSEWFDKQSKEQPQFKFWATTLDLELKVLEFIRSIRERNFQMYIQTLLNLVPWLFAFDHVNYSRWLPIHISDMVNLQTTHPEVYNEFMKGHFAVNKTNRVFSAMAMDQCHEQLNDLIKGEGGAVGLTECPQALERWMVAGPEISRLIQEFENNSVDLRSKTSTKHHEQNQSMQNAFAKDVKSFVTTLEELGNPFLEDSGDLLTIDTKLIKSKEISQNMYTIEHKGKEDYKQFVNERLTAAQNKSLSVTISKNNFHIFVIAAAKKNSKTSKQIKSLKLDRDFFARLYIGCQSRQGDFVLFFRHENRPYPPSISDLGELKLPIKSDLLDCLEQLVPSCKTPPEVDVKVFDGAVLVHMLRPSGCKTFKDYNDKVFQTYIEGQLRDVQRVDVVWDRYLPESLKQSTRDKRTQSGKTQRQRVLSTSPIPTNWESFLRLEENKDELFSFLSECMKSYNASGKVIVSTQGELVNTAGHIALQDIETLQPCSHEEADTRIILHVLHCAKQGYKRISIRTVDTDIVVLAVGHVQSLNVDELWVDFGVRNHRRYIAAHALANILNEKAKALMLFHAITGCDTVSGFRGRGKKTAWTAWLSYPEVTETFLTLLSTPVEIDESILEKIQRFIVVMYSKTCSLTSVNEARRELFTQCSRTIDNIPPTKNALIQHLRRAVYQAGYIWAQALEPNPKLPSPEHWGWKATDSGWKPFWTDLADA